MSQIWIVTWMGGHRKCCDKGQVIAFISQLLDAGIVEFKVAEKL